MWRPRMPCANWYKPGGSIAGSGKAVICIVHWIERGARNSGPHARLSKRLAMTCRRPRLCSLVCWTNNRGDSSPAWKACTGGMAVNNTWRRCSVWMWTPSPAVNGSCSAVRCYGDGCDRRVAADRPWKKNAANPEPPPRFIARGHRRRSDGPARFVDREAAQRHQPGTGPVGFARLSEHGPPFVEGSRLRPPCQPQKSLCQYKPPSRPTVRLAQSSTPGVQHERISDYQRGHQEKGTGGPVQKQRPGVESRPHPGARS